MTPDHEPIEIQHEYTVGPDFARRMARAFTAYVLGRPATIVVTALLSVFGAALLILAVWLGDGGFAAFGIAYLVFMPIYALLVYLRTLRGNAQRLPVGSRIAVGLGASGMRTEGPLGSGVTSHRAYRSVFVRGGFVILRHRGVRVFSLFPVELFPGTELDLLRAGVQQANH